MGKLSSHGLPAQGTGGIQAPKTKPAAPVLKTKLPTLGLKPTKRVRTQGDINVNPPIKKD